MTEPFAAARQSRQARKRCPVVVATPLPVSCQAAARIFRPSRSVMTSARVTSRPWRLVFERRGPPVIEPLMGYCGGGDTLTQVQLDFPSVDAAVDFAENQGLDYVIRTGPAERPRPNVRDPFGKTAARSVPLQHQRREVKQR
ncbi:proton-conducting membrane transporter [Mesorhizobium sp. M3A.F.Ca.ET.201.01.1.1]|uniref:NADH dehydrogenase ubiquinone Fe-S protein 4 n=1 Tax=Mesorhizobium sp. M3A.F.Ca.ET.201.01.1.1 TaxID=2563946 RepID=UPI001093972C|nr:NADH dehydrogenase ubiquinone Fe-S protein 4 [Mesorhizobium sp. M3A.F.Ca.ET.201.01.1.1]TGS71498.1 proton-conducting membrane transporter [Mesorhizobium sp. M3A.F.Ca.ET.201.01.1.1]